MQYVQNYFPDHLKEGHNLNIYLDYLFKYQTSFYRHKEKKNNSSYREEKSFQEIYFYKFKKMCFVGFNIWYTFKSKILIFVLWIFAI